MVEKERMHGGTDGKGRRFFPAGQSGNRTKRGAFGEEQAAAEPVEGGEHGQGL